MSDRHVEYGKPAVPKLS